VAGSYEHGNELSVPLQMGNFSTNRATVRFSKRHELLRISEFVIIRITGMLYWSQSGLYDACFSILENKCPTDTDYFHTFQPLPAVGFPENDIST
jgi:hypothetical protein